MAHGRRPDPALEQYRRRTFIQFRESGVTVRQFCERHDLRPPTFYAWQRRLAGRDRRRAADTRPTPAFVPVRVVATTPLEVVVASGRVARVGPGFDPAHLRAVVAALEAPPC